MEKEKSEREEKWGRREVEVREKLFQSKEAEERREEKKNGREKRRIEEEK